MEYLEAVKKVQTTKPKDNFMVIKLDYETQLILPHKDGVAFMAALASAEQFNTHYSKPHSICELDRDKLTVTTMSCVEYERYKIATLLGVTVDEVKQFALQTH